MTDNDFNELEELAQRWIAHITYLACAETLIKDGVINNCGEELLKMVVALREKRANNLNAIAKVTRML